MSKLTTHWHISTYAHPSTPAYPDKDARHIYQTACALKLDSSGQNEDYALTQFDEKLVNCKRCLTWLTWKNDANPNSATIN